ncbi:GDP-mannose 6-dehydrogenase [Stieleria maiorica]|uniref:UDP-glucose 6-dehydrogenase n=1 Tax=Stieleria maiorica TaxID=2795974 RepID=A0A5B9MEC9_9BACT|nr:nucleotide sugar dehydrogenase [Stieleria maiorica]QEF99622.1 GDP-mannose 6-dehydrogenase [Stieleria maiorica]
MTRVAVFGMGYVGCVSAACLSRDGHSVIGVDIDPGKVESIASGRSPIFEPGLDELLKQQVDSGRLRATTDVAEAVSQSDVAMIAVGTPSEQDGMVSLKAVRAVLTSIGQTLADQDDRDYTIVLRSTLLPGILEDQLISCLESTGCALGAHVRVCNNPEFLRETTAIKDYDCPPFIVVGCQNPADADAVLDLYADLPGERVVTDCRTAAMVKYVCNAFHAAKIVFANEVGALASSMGADGQEVMKIACKDTQLNISPAYLRPGFAFGGSCLPKDVRALNRYAQAQALETNLLSSLLPSNEAHIRRALNVIKSQGCRRIGLVGLSFKAGTDDLRESPLVTLAETLLGQGYELRIYDPGVRVAKLMGTNLAYVDTRLPHLAALLVSEFEEVCSHAEYLILGTDVANEVDVPLALQNQVFDLRRDLVVANPQPVTP